MKKLKWQDTVMMIVAIAFCYSLIPQIFFNIRIHEVNLSWQTLVISPIGLLISAFCFFTLKLYYTSVTTLFSATCWLIMLIQKITF